MKKFLFGSAVLMSSMLFTACDNNDSPNKYVVPVSNGVYLVCSGNQSNSINGSLTYYDYISKSSVKDAFSAANSGQSLGLTANDALRYGEKLYIVGDGEHCVFVCNAKTQKLIQRIDLTAGSMLGETGGVSPRRITADDGKIYVSTYGGFVAAIDTTNFALVNKYQTGSYPEGIAISDGYLIVANSDFGYGNASISVINLSSGSTETLKDENIRNPQTIAIAGSDIYFLDWGQYGPAPTYAQENAGVYKITGNGSSSITVKKVIADATEMACAGTKIYTINAPYAYGVSNPVTYTVYDIVQGSSKDYTLDEIEYPVCIGVDQLTNRIYIAARQGATGEWGSYADYSADGYVNIYDTNFTKVGNFTCGVGPTRFAFNIGTEEIVY